MVDLHRHDECSTFDGFGRSEELSKQAKEKGLSALGISNHGNTNSLVRHYFSCKEEGIKPIMGCEGYFLPAYKEKTRGYHLCLFVKNLKGYENLNRLQSEGEKIKYYNPIWTFDLIKKYHEGLICSTACVASYSSQCIINGRIDLAEKYLIELKKIFGNDLYIEVQPYVISDPGIQEKVNLEMIKLGQKLKIKCILTSDSHYGSKEDFDTYLKMHEIADHNLEEISKTYSERYMPTEDEIAQRFIDMHNDDFGSKTEKFAKGMIKNLEEIESKVDDEILEKLEQKLPVFDENYNSYELLRKKIKDGLKAKGKYNKTYVNRIKTELEIVKYHHFEDYFLIVADYVNWAKSQGIYVGPGRGSGCNCLINYALNITETDPIFFKLDFERFLRKDKKKMPDIDLDFETSRRDEVIQYLLQRYPNNSAQICSYGLYRIDNLLNDLFKVCGLKLPSKTKENFDQNEYNRIDELQNQVKGLVNKYIDHESGDFDHVHALKDPQIIQVNKKYDNIVKHFSKLYKKIRFIGTHAAGVAIAGDDINKYTALRVDTKSNKLFTNYDLSDMERIQVIKFDILGLTTMSMIGELRELTDHKGFDENLIYDKKILHEFNEGDCDGIFQFDKKSVQSLLRQIGCDSFNDVIAASAMNRPGPLSLGIPEIYAKNKVEGSNDKDLPYYKYIEDTYGCAIYQEQIQAIAVNIGGLEWPEADKIVKMSRGGTEKAVRNFEENYDNYLKKFEEGAKRFGMTKKQSFDIFDTFFNYSFNKGHSTGYSLISAEQMYYKVYYPTEFWYITLKYANEKDYWKLAGNAVRSGVVILLPHINGTSKHSLTKIEGERCLQEGLSLIKGVGEKVADFIEYERKENGPYKDKDDFLDRIEPYKRVVNTRVIKILEEQGALEFDKRKYFSRVKKYNSSLYSR